MLDLAAFGVLLAHGVAIIGNIGYGWTLERLVKGAWGQDAERFDAYSLLLLSTSLCAAIVGLAGLTLSGPKAGEQRASAVQRLTARLGGATHTQLATVAGLGWVSAYCQYHALSHVSFTTLSLASCIRFLPVFDIWAQLRVDGLRANLRPLLALTFAGTGAGLYLTNLRTAPSALLDDQAFSDAVLGAVFLGGYICFDRLSRRAALAFAAPQPTPSSYFPPPAASTSLLSPDNVALAQFTAVQLCSVALSFGGLVFDAVYGMLFPSLRLLLVDGALLRDVFLFALASAGVLFALISAKSNLGPETATVLETGRIFVTLFTNCALFRHSRTISLVGWAGVGWVGSGMFYQLDGFTRDAEGTIGLLGSPSYRGLSDLEADELLKSELESGSSRASSPESWTSSSSSTPASTSSARRQLCLAICVAGYVVPVLLPALIASAVGVAIPDFDARIQQPEFLAAVDGAVEGGNWEVEFHDAIEPLCGSAGDTVKWEGTRRTVLASNPRSGNTYTRELIERSTNLQTSTVSYCDYSLRKTFVGECDHQANFLVKSHFPDGLGDVNADYLAENKFDQIVHLVRNPIDAIFSGWQMAHVPKTADGQLDHSGRLEISDLGATSAQYADVMERARVWKHHTQFWRSQIAPIHTVRYEDLMKNRLPTLMSLLSFLLPDSLPPLSQISCTLEVDESREAYKSRKSSEFASWPMFDSKTRVAIVELLREDWCKLGYGQLLREVMGSETGVDDVCSR